MGKRFSQWNATPSGSAVEAVYASSHERWQRLNKRLLASESILAVGILPVGATGVWQVVFVAVLFSRLTGLPEPGHTFGPDRGPALQVSRWLKADGEGRSPASSPPGALSIAFDEEDLRRWAGRHAFRRSPGDKDLYAVLELKSYRWYGVVHLAPYAVVLLLAAWAPHSLVVWPAVATAVFFIGGRLLFMLTRPWVYEHHPCPDSDGLVSWVSALPLK